MQPIQTSIFVLGNAQPSESTHIQKQSATDAIKEANQKELEATMKGKEGLTQRRASTEKTFSV